MNLSTRSRRATRRAFLQHGALLLTAAAVADPGPLFANEPANNLRVGLLTDLHYADKPPAGTRHYRETLDKLAEAGRRFAELRPAFVVELGDFIDAAASVEVEQRYLATIQERFAALADERHYVLGNHCVDTLTKPEFLAGVGQERSYYSFERGDYHFIVLDSCFRSDGQPYQRRNFQWTDPNIPPAEVAWLRDDLAATDKHVVVFAHQRLDVGSPYGVKNAAEVRQLFEASGRVLAVFQGHSHHNALQQIGGVHYCTLAAMIEGSGAEQNGYSLLELDPQGDLRLTGFRRQQSHHWKRAG